MLTPFTTLATLALLAADVGGTHAPVGVHLGVGVGVGVVGGDVVAAVDVGVGIETSPFALHLRAPPIFRLVDLPPTVPSSQPSACRVFRCEEALNGQRLDPTALARVIDEVRLFRPGDVVHARVGRLTATLGAAATVDRLTTMASWDRRTSGAFGSLRLPFQELRADVVVADVISPLELVAGRVEGAPLPFIPIVVGVEGAVDAFAPDDVVDDAGVVGPTVATRPVGAGLVDVRVPITLGVFSLAPRGELSATTGLTADGGDVDGGVASGGGGAVGLEAGFKVSFVELSGLTMVGASSPGHRRGLFSTFHLVERRRALVGSAVDGGGLVHVPAPGGLSVDVRLEASILDAVAPLLRLHLEPSPGANAVEVGTVFDIDPVQVSVSVIRRGFVDVGGVFDADVDARPVLVAAEAAWRIVGPVSLWARWYRLPRFGGGTLKADDDVLVGVAIAGALQPR
jgi:hypothetical protein